jgi:hypothetical protein
VELKGDNIIIRSPGPGERSLAGFVWRIMVGAHNGGRNGLKFDGRARRDGVNKIVHQAKKWSRIASA